jgi:hypothetical protein
MDSSLNIHFYNKSSKKDTAIYYLFAYGTGNEESILIDTTYNTSSASLLLNLNSDTSQYLLTLVTLVKSFTDSTKYYDSITPGPPPDTIWKYKKFVNRILATNTETLTVTYTRKIELVSHECGFSYYIQLDSVWSTKKIINSVSINKALIERGINEDNIKIFL